MTEYCYACKRIPLLADSEYNSGLCYDCQDAAIEKSLRMRDWAEFHDGELYDERASDPLNDAPRCNTNRNSFTPPTTSPVGGGGADLAAGTANPVLEPPHAEPSATKGQRDHDRRF